MDLEKLTELAHIVAKPWRITTYILAFLLFVSLAGNIYLATLENSITLEGGNYNNENAAEWSVNQTNGE